MDRSANISLARAHESIQALLGNHVPVTVGLGIAETKSGKFLEDLVSTGQQIVEKIRGWVDAARKMAQRCKQQMAAFLKIVIKIRHSEFILSHLEHFDLHVLLTRIRMFMAHRACRQAPLFKYGPELCEYRHRFR